MLSRKEKDVKKYLLNDNIEFSNEDKENVLNKIKSKINLEVEEKPSFRQKFNHKVVYALVCSLIICVVGFLGIKNILIGNLIDPNYIGKDVESLNLDEGDYCLAYNVDFEYEQYVNLSNKYDLKFEYKKSKNAYLITKGKSILFIYGEYKNGESCMIQLVNSSTEIIDIYNSTYNKSFNKENLNNDKSGLLFLITDNGIEFYTRENNKKLSIFVEFA